MASDIPFKYANYSGTPPPADATSFKLTTSSGVDIWRKPPSTHVFNAPLLYKPIPISRFQRVRVTVHAQWRTLYDQGGLVFIMPQADGSNKWIKSGIEFFEGRPYVSTVSADNWADWSLVETDERDPETLTLEFERRAKDETLWIYVVKGEKKVPVREVTWALEEKDAWVGVYVGKPTASETGEDSLEVMFSDFHLELRD